MKRSTSAKRPIQFLRDSDATSDSALERLLCPGCRKPLDVHQPQLDRPDRLLGTCDGCDTWSRCDVDADGRVVAIHRLVAEDQPSS